MNFGDGICISASTPLRPDSVSAKLLATGVAEPERHRLLGYARVSSAGQDLAYQLQRLGNAGCVKIYQEKRSARDMAGRPELRRLLMVLKPGDVLLATASDRVARDPVDLLNILQAVRRANAGLRLLDEPFIDTTSELADLILFLVGWAARWQRRRILENTSQGRELARQRGVKFGRRPKLDAAQRQEIHQQKLAGLTIAEIAKSFGVSPSTISRVE